MITNDICQTCGHYFVCKKLNVLEKFDTENKKYIGVDINILSCRDYSTDDENSGEDKAAEESFEAEESMENEE